MASLVLPMLVLRTHWYLGVGIRAVLGHIDIVISILQQHPIRPAAMRTSTTLLMPYLLKVHLPSLAGRNTRSTASLPPLGRTTRRTSPRNKTVSSHASLTTQSSLQLTSLRHSHQTMSRNNLCAPLTTPSRPTPRRPSHTLPNLLSPTALQAQNQRRRNQSLPPNSTILPSHLHHLSRL